MQFVKLLPMLLYKNYQKLLIIDETDIKNALLKYDLLIKSLIEAIVMKHGLITYRMRKMNIDYIESLRNNVIIHTCHKDISIRMTLKDLLKELDESFIQVHKSYIVNMNKIDEVKQSYVRLKNDEKIIIGHKFKEQFMKQYNHYQKTI